MFTLRVFATLLFAALCAAEAGGADESPFLDIKPETPSTVPTKADKQEIRTWADDTGKFQTQASFVDFRDGKVHLKLMDGTIRVLPIERLSASDQEYVRRTAATITETRPIGASGSPGQGPAGAGTSKPSPFGPPSAASMPASGHLKWLSEVIIPSQRMVDALNEIWTLTPSDAESRAVPLRAAASSASSQGKLAAALLSAVANERAGKRDVALGEYRQLATDAKDTPFGVSGAFRAIVLEGQNVRQKLAALPSVDGWFLVAASWTWTNSRSAAQALAPTSEAPVTGSGSDRPPGFWSQGVAGLLGGRSAWWARLIAVVIYGFGLLVGSLQVGAFYKNMLQTQGMPKEAAGCASFFGSVIGLGLGYILYWGLPIDGLGWGIMIVLMLVASITITSIVTSD